MKIIKLESIDKSYPESKVIFEDIDVKILNFIGNGPKSFTDIINYCRKLDFSERNTRTKLQLLVQYNVLCLNDQMNLERCIKI